MLVDGRGQASVFHWWRWADRAGNQNRGGELEINKQLANHCASAPAAASQPWVESSTEVRTAVSKENRWDMMKNAKDLSVCVFYCIFATRLCRSQRRCRLASTSRQKNVTWWLPSLKMRPGQKPGGGSLAPRFNLEEFIFFQPRHPGQHFDST